MISREEKLSIQKQVRLLRLSRSSFYYRPRAVSDADSTLPPPRRLRAALPLIQGSKAVQTIGSTSNEVYGTMAVYMRLKGLVPPSTAMRGRR